MFCVLFPGQGSQYVGMGRDLYEKYEIVRNIYNKVDNQLGYPLSQITLNGPKSELDLTKNTQPAIMTLGVSIFMLLKHHFNLNLNKANFFAGHSLGEYTALVCANALTVETAAYLLHERGKAMQEAVPSGQGAMLAVLGMNIDELSNEIKSIEKKYICELANDNCPGQLVVSGEVMGINILKEKLKKKSKKAILLNVSAPFHCSLMKKASDKMSLKITKTNFTIPNPSMISNVNAKEENDPNKIKNLLIEQIISKVQWRESIEYILKQKVFNFLEIGPGKVLSGLVKRINKKTNIKNLTNIEEIEKYLNNDKF